MPLPQLGPHTSGQVLVLQDQSGDGTGIASATLVMVTHDHEILDGCLRYRILLDMGVETVPCLVREEREGFTGNRMVNQITASQESTEKRHSHPPWFSPSAEW